MAAVDSRSVHRSLATPFIQHEGQPEEPPQADRRAGPAARGARFGARAARQRVGQGEGRRSRLPARARGAGAARSARAESPARCPTRRWRASIPKSWPPAGPWRTRWPSPTSGPKGTFSQEAALKHFGGATATAPCASIDEVFRQVETGAAGYGVVPVENSTEGAIGRTLDLLLSTPAQVCGEVMLPIRQCLMSRERSARRHPQGLLAYAKPRPVPALARAAAAPGGARRRREQCGGGASRGPRAQRGGDRPEYGGCDLPARRSSRATSRTSPATPRASSSSPRATPTRPAATRPPSSCPRATCRGRSTRCSRRSRRTASA